MNISTFLEANLNVFFWLTLLIEQHFSFILFLLFIFLVSFDWRWGQLFNFSFLGLGSCSANFPGNFLSSVEVVVVGDPASLRLHALVEDMALPVVVAEVNGFAVLCRKSPYVSGLLFSIIPLGIDLFNGDVLQSSLPPLGGPDVQGVVQFPYLVTIKPGLWNLVG